MVILSWPLRAWLAPAVNNSSQSLTFMLQMTMFDLDLSREI